MTSTPLRSDRFASAALRIVANEGLDQLSIRRVAAEAGWSAGALQKVFATKDDLLDAALDLVVRQAEARMDRLEASGTVSEQLTALVLETLPLDAQRRDEALVWTAFCLRAAYRPAMASVLKRHDRDLLDALTAALTEAQDQYQIPPDIDASSTAQAVVALADGFAIRLLYDPTEQTTVMAALDKTIRRLVGD